MAGLTRKDIKDIMKEAVKEALTDNTLLKEMIAECIKTSVVTILKEINIQDTQITESRDVRPSQSLFQEKPLITSASKTNVGKKPVQQRPPSEPAFSPEAMRAMFENEFGVGTPSAAPHSNPAKINIQDMNDTEEDDPRVLRALGIR